MKTVTNKLGLVLRLATAVSMLLIVKPALAVGTDAGTQVLNRATVNYSVGAVPQTLIESSPTGNSTAGATNGTDTEFVVDRRIDFTLVQVGTSHTTVTPGDTNAFVEFLLTNTSNSTLDFNLNAIQLGSGDGAVNTLVDTNVNMNNLSWAVGTSVANGDADPAPLGQNYIDELIEDDAIRIRVYGDAALTLANGDIANIELSATAAAPGAAAVEGAALTETAGPDNPLVIDNVFADTGNDGVESDRDGFQVVSAALTITKVATVISDPINGATDPKAIPGAIVEYVITVANSSTTAATAVSINDVVDADVTLLLNVAAYTGEDALVDNNGTVLACNVENNADGDGCDLVGSALTFGDTAEVSITVAGSTTLTISFRVEIPN